MKGLLSAPVKTNERRPSSTSNRTSTASQASKKSGSSRVSQGRSRRNHVGVGAHLDAEAKTLLRTTRSRQKSPPKSPPKSPRSPPKSPRDDSSDNSKEVHKVTPQGNDMPSAIELDGDDLDRRLAPPPEVTIAQQETRNGDGIPSAQQETCNCDGVISSIDYDRMNSDIQVALSDVTIGATESDAHSSSTPVLDLGNGRRRSSGSYFQGGRADPSELFHIEPDTVSDDCINLINPSLVLHPSSELCGGVKTEFVFEILTKWETRSVLFAFVMLPLGGLLLDVSGIISEDGAVACHWYNWLRLVSFVTFLISILRFLKLNRERQPRFPLLMEQWYILSALIVLLIKQRVWTTNYFASEKDFCNDDFSVAAKSAWVWPGFHTSVSDHEMLRSIDLLFHLLMLEVFALKQRSIPSLKSHVLGIAVVCSERLFLHVSRQVVEQTGQGQLHKVNSEHLCDTLRLLLLVHKTYVAYMSLKSMSYLRSRSRQLGFWLITLPAIWRYMIFLIGNQLAALYEVFRYDSAAENSTYFGQVIVFELKFLILAVLYTAPSMTQKERPGFPRLVRFERSSDLSFVLSRDCPLGFTCTRKAHRRGNMVKYAADVKTVSHVLQPVFCLETACWAFNCSYFVYFNQPAEEGDQPTPGAMDHGALAYTQLRVIKFFADKIGGGQGCLFADVSNPSRIFLAFRGTASLSHVVTDIKAWCEEVHIGYKDDEKFWVHSGFYTSYKTVGVLARHALNEYLALLPSASAASLVICGHSLGGALATLMAIDNIDWLQSLGVRNVKVYTFGAPCVGDAVFASYVESRITNFFRIRQCVDPVPRLPNRVSGLLFILFGGKCLLWLVSLCTENAKDVVLFYKQAGHAVVMMQSSIGDLILNPMPIEKHLYMANVFLDAGQHLLPAYRAGLMAALWQLRGEDCDAKPHWPMENELDKE